MIEPEAQLRSMVAADQEPTLSEEEILMLLDNNTIPSRFPTWAPETAYTVGSLVVPYPRNGRVYSATVAGTSGTSQPVFPDDETSTVSDGTVTWQQSNAVSIQFGFTIPLDASIPRGYELAYNFRKAAAQGWLLKAGKVANRVDMKADVHALSRSQMYKQCMDMYKAYSRGTAGSVPVITAGYASSYPVLGNVNPAP